MRVTLRLPISVFGIVLLSLLSTTATSEETRSEVGIRHLHMMFQLCRAVEPGFEIRNASNYDIWLRRNWETVQKFSEKPWYRDAVKEYIRQESNSKYGRPNCQGLIEILDLSARPPDPLFSSPEQTWATFSTALRQADRKVLSTCLVGTAESKWKDVFRDLSEEDLRRMGNAIKKMSIDGGDDQMKSAWVTRHDGNVAAVVFVKVYGNWKISEM